MSDDGVTDTVERLQRQLYEQSAEFDADASIVGAAMLLAGLQLIAEPFLMRASPAERKLIRSHYPDATDQTIDAHRLSQNGLMILMEYVVTAGRKYLDHQPETSNILVATSPSADLERLIQTIARGVSNSFASAAPLGASTYDIAAAIITNCVARAIKEDVAPEQLATILLENVQRVIA